MKLVEWLMILMTGIFYLGVAGCLLTLPFVVWQFATVLWEKKAPDEQEAADSTESAA
jgi:hypothetical protein